MIKLTTAAALIAFTLSQPANAFSFGDALDSVKESAKSTIEETVGTTDSSDSSSGLSASTVSAGLKEALEVGAKHAVELLGAENGYLNNSLVRIPLPDSIEKVSSTMRKYGLDEQVDQFELSMNRAAEKAVPQATELIINSLNEMTLEDSMAILNGSDNAATEYFREHTQDDIAKLFQPEIESSLASVNATKYYNQLTEKAEDIPFIGDFAKDANLEEHVTDSALDGLFALIAIEEKKIRENPVARTTELLKQVFSN
ncbi:DUF4197 domain-containing protein [Marinomonas colpomeniae]|uniref:DUF4197 domain-containing protein n=1 Tax=Marinomonas colpomeniae TaxID=2774408 RepID=A0ABR8NW94_9GAMM|nr:DUF4197 domain-containing protein [Marinomonas colpomeniae]MBD5770314.1 DUF4197 domain-containing protein [Marinomonas colpomeniae]